MNILKPENYIWTDKETDEKPIGKVKDIIKLVLEMEEDLREVDAELERVSEGSISHKYLLQAKAELEQKIRNYEEMSVYKHSFRFLSGTEWACQ